MGILSLRYFRLLSSDFSAIVLHMGILKDITFLAKNRTTYDIGLVQARGYRALKQTTALALKPEGLTTIEWAMLGIISHHETGIRTSEVAEILGVQPPLVSRLISKAETGGWITIATGTDKRERILILSKQGRSQIERIERQVRTTLKPLLAGVAPRDLIGYLRTLSRISENSSDLPSGTAADYIPD